MEVEVLENERIDDLQIKGLKIIQDRDGFCFGVDAVLLANFAEVKKGEKVVDLGTGTGIIPILIAGKTQASSIIGVEIQKKVADMAGRSVILNNLESRVKIVNNDLKKASEYLDKGGFDVVTTNPPYKNSGSGIVNPTDSKAISRHEIKCSLEDVISTSFFLLKDGGKFFMVHRPERIVDVLCIMRKYKLEPKKIRFVHPYHGKKPNLFLVEGLKYGKPFLNFMDPLYVYDGDGNFSKEIIDIYGRDVLWWENFTFAGHLLEI